MSLIDKINVDSGLIIKRKNNSYVSLGNASLYGLNNSYAVQKDGYSTAKSKGGNYQKAGSKYASKATDYPKGPKIVYKDPVEEEMKRYKKKFYGLLNTGYAFS